MLHLYEDVQLNFGHCVLLASRVTSSCTLEGGGASSLDYACALASTTMYTLTDLWPCGIRPVPNGNHYEMGMVTLIKVGVAWKILRTLHPPTSNPGYIPDIENVKKFPTKLCLRHHQINTDWHQCNNYDLNWSSYKNFISIVRYALTAEFGPPD